jgi:glyoxylase-like metal-dependent hydrolase (beta-lactamase superfamily II)
MKLLHRPDLYGWSRFDESRNIDFHSVLWRRGEGNVVIDPLPLSDHERARLAELGGVRHVVITNSDHVRAAAELVASSGAQSYGPRAEADSFPIRCDAWLADGDEIVPGLTALGLEGSKTPGELALLLEGTTLITGDLIRAHGGGRLDMLPSAKLADAALAQRSLERLAALPGLEAVLPGDGWPIFRDGQRALGELLLRVRAAI